MTRHKPQKLFYSAVQWVSLSAPGDTTLRPQNDRTSGRMVLMVLQWLILPAHLKQWRQETKSRWPVKHCEEEWAHCCPWLPQSQSHWQSMFQYQCWELGGAPGIQPLPQTQTGNPVWRRRCTIKDWPGGEPIRMPPSLRWLLFCGSSQRSYSLVKVAILQRKNTHFSCCHGSDNPAFQLLLSPTLQLLVWLFLVLTRQLTFQLLRWLTFQRLIYI